MAELNRINVTIFSTSITFCPEEDEEEQKVEKKNVSQKDKNKNKLNNNIVH